MDLHKHNVSTNATINKPQLQKKNPLTAGGNLGAEIRSQDSCCPNNIHRDGRGGVLTPSLGKADASSPCLVQKPPGLKVYGLAGTNTTHFLCRSEDLQCLHSTMQEPWFCTLLCRHACPQPSTSLNISPRC